MIKKKLLHLLYPFFEPKIWMGKPHRLLIIILLFGSSLAKAQTWKDLSMDEIYFLSRTDAFEGKYAEAKEKLSFILADAEHPDASILLGTVLSWERDFAGARSILRPMVQSHPRNIDAVIALANTELWDHKLLDALELIEYGISLEDGKNETLNITKAKILIQLGRHTVAMQVLTELVNENPGHKEARELRNELVMASRKFSLGMRTTLDVFSRDYGTSWLTTIEIGYEFARMPAYCRLNYRNRSSLHGLQYETELYPRLSKNVYACLNYGFSGNNLFPQHRAGGDVFFQLPAGFEISTGARYLNFDLANNVFVYNAGIQKYHKKSLAGLKVFVGESRDHKASLAGSIHVKHFIDGGHNYLSYSVTIGFMPDNRRIQNIVDGPGISNALLKTQSMNVLYQRPLFRSLSVNVGFELARQELAFGKNSYLWTTSLAIGVQTKI